MARRRIKNNPDQGTFFIVDQESGAIVMHEEVNAPIVAPDDGVDFEPVHLRTRTEHILNALDSIAGMNSRDGFLEYSQTFIGLQIIRARYGNETEKVIKRVAEKRSSLLTNARDELWQAAGMQVLTLAGAIAPVDVQHERDVLFAGFWDTYGGANHSEARIAYETRMHQYLHDLNPFRP